MVHIRELLNFDRKNVLRALTIALLLFFDASVGSLRTLPPLYLLYGIFIIILLTAWWVWKLIRRTGLAQTPISSPLILYLAVVVISTILSVDLRRSLDGLLATTSVVLLFFLICDLVLSGWDTDTFIWALLIFVTLLLTQGLVEIISWYWRWFQLQVSQYPTFLLRYRLFGITAWPSKLVMLIYLCLPFVLFKLSDTQSNWKKTFWITWLLVAEIVFIYSDTRGGMFAGAVVLIITLGWLIYQKGTPKKGNLRAWIYSKKKFLGTLSAFIISYILIYWIWQLPSHTGATRHGGGISAGRLSFWQVAVDVFKEYPLFGSGPITYPRFYMQDFPSGIFGWVSPHAHNIILNTAAQFGILGLIALGYLLLSLIFYTIRSPRARYLILKSPSNPKSSLIIGVVAGLIGVFIHSMLDRLEETPHTILPLLMLVVVGLHTLYLVKNSSELNKRIAWIFFLFPIFASVLLFRVNTAQSYQLNSLLRGIENDWSEASRLVKEATDLDPGLNFYNEQRGYAYGAAALSSEVENSEKYLSEAMTSYELAIEEYPYWGPNYVNLAELFNFAGKPEDSLSTLESIPETWLKTWTFPQILLAGKYQEIGLFAKSTLLYKNALEQDYWLKVTAICIRSDLCRETANQILFEKDSEFSIHSKAISLIYEGYPQIALKQLEVIPPEASSALIWVDRAAAHCALSEYSQCEYTLAVAEHLNAASQQPTAALYSLTKSNLLKHKISIQEAIKILESYILPLVRPKNYESIVYQRVGFPNYLLPSLAILEKTENDLRIYSELEDLYLEENRIEDAEWARNQADLLSNLLETN